MTYATEQEHFWAGAFGDAYIARNQGDRLDKANFALFAKILRSMSGVRSFVELGCNIGLNLKALHAINPGFAMSGYEINETAAQKARELGVAQIHTGTILQDLAAGQKHDVSFTKGVLIHINPEALPAVYANLYNLSNRYIIVCEYYNPAPTTIDYRGAKEKLFKRDFAGELMDLYDLRLVDYGFVYRRDPYFPQDDCTWFLLEKNPQSLARA